MDEITRLFGIAGWSGSGKTTLIVRLLPELIRRGITVSTIKHAHHSFDIDRPGKDSHDHRSAGASEVMITSRDRWALMHENRTTPEPSLEDVLARMAPVDLILIEGFKADAVDKLEVHRTTLGKELLCPGDPRIVAVACETALPSVDLPVLNLDDAVRIVDFIVDHCGLAPGRWGVA